MSVDSNVVVVGGGLAGCMAALSAAANGARVLLVTKGRIGETGNSARASGGFAAASRPKDSADLHASDTLSGGYDVNQMDVVREFTGSASGALQRLDALIGGFETDRDGLVGHAVPAHSMPRSVQYLHGTAHLMVKIRQRLASSGVEIAECQHVVDLELDERGAVCGVFTFDPEGSSMSLVPARAVVLATGGCGQLFPVTSNGPDMTGDGPAIALRAGASLRDMEFIQFTPTAFAAPQALRGHTIVGTLLTLDGVTLRNAEGERFMQRYAPNRLEQADRATLARAIHREVTEGRGTPSDGVHLDLTSVPPDDLNRHRPGFVELLKSHGIDPAVTPLETAPAVHTMLGGIATNKARSSVPGLYAAGECTGGAHGANRLSSNSLSEANVTGWNAGEAAAQFAAGKTSMAAKVLAWPGLPETGSESTERMKQELQVIMASGAGVERERSTIETALEGINSLRRRHASMRPGHVAHWLDLCNMILTGDAILRSALVREESRGCHFRADFPDASKDWLCNVFLELRQGELVTSTEPVAAVIMEE